MTIDAPVIDNLERPTSGRAAGGAVTLVTGSKSARRWRDRAGRV